MERDGTPAGQESESRVCPSLPGSLGGVAPDAVQAITEVIVLHREFPAWAVWLPHGGRPWVAVRPASARAPGPDLAMIWVEAMSAAELADRMQRVDGQLTAPDR